MVKYKQQVQDMLLAHQDIFETFKKLHDNYEKDPKKWQDEFNEKGIEIQSIIRRWENSLCGKSESGRYGKFSSNLAEKFREEIKVHFSKIDYIGMKNRD
jgi:hypothetical protein